MKIMMRFLIVLVAVGLASGCASRRSQSGAGKQPAPAAEAPAPTSMLTPDYMKPEYGAAGLVPPMEPGRKINEQDCTQPINLTAGNLRCR